jgi:serine carboxypeptidase-like clade IV
MLDFLQEFFDAHPELADNDVYVTGESYAGHYVPAVSHRIWKYNKAPTGAPIHFKGLAIGMLFLSALSLGCCSACAVLQSASDHS